MRRNKTAPVPQSNSLQAARQCSNRAARRVLRLMTMLFVSAAAAFAAPAERPRETVLKLVAQIQRADYEGNRVALQSLSADPKDLEHDLTQALAEFKESSAKDPAFVDATVGTISCLGNLMYLARGHADRVQELLAQSIPLVKEVRGSHPDNPRFVWVLGPILCNTPAERGGGQDKAIESYLKGLESARKLKGTVTDPLEPSWGEPELLMSLA